MKVGLITFHFVNNYGGVLQAYSLQEYLKEICGEEVSIINYKNTFVQFTDAVRIFPITSDVSELFTGIKTIPLRLKRVSYFNQFLKQNVSVTEKVDSIDSVIEKNMFDCLICGSDQIWNPVITFGFDKNYYLGQKKANVKRIAYAPSIGKNRISKKSEKKLKGYISNIDYCSVRELETQRELEKMLDKDIEVLIDPTFLLKKEKWGKLAQQVVAPKEKYILVYIMQKDNKVYDYSRKVKEKYGLKVIEISRYGKRNEGIDEVLVDVGPLEFLSLFYNAEYICTNSFHGLAFSLIFDKKFSLIPCKRFGTRLENLISLFQIEFGQSEQFKYEGVVDADKKEQILLSERTKTYNYFITSMGRKND